jgi:proline iminopeptidase
MLERAHLIEAYGRLLQHPDPEVHEPAAIAWARWESSTITLLPQADTIARFTAPEFATAFARIENHYFRHGGWWEEGQLIRDATRLAGIPAVIIQGRYDICTPTMTAWELHKAWPEAELRIIGDAGHAYDEPGILDALIRATDHFAGGYDAGDDEDRGDEAQDRGDDGDGDGEDRDDEEDRGDDRDDRDDEGDRGDGDRDDDDGDGGDDRDDEGDRDDDRAHPDAENGPNVNGSAEGGVHPASGSAAE